VTGLCLAVAELTTTAESTGFSRTGRYEEAVRICTELEDAHRGRARCTRFGLTPEGRPMVAVVASADGVLDPQAAKAKKRPVVLFQGGIHAGEIDGKDAGFWAVRELLEGKSTPKANPLTAVTAVFVPVFNIDGHERFGPNNRPNQVGPEEMGWRTTGQNLNLNRDYAKAESPEMQAMLALLEAWDPIVYMDLHVTDGAQFQHDVAVMVEPANVGPDPLRSAGRKLRDELMKKLEATGHQPLTFYPSFRKRDDPSSGFEVGIAPPRFSAAYWSLRNRFGMLVETHSWKDYKTRVKATYDTILGVLELAARDGTRWRSAAESADKMKLAGQDFPLVYDATDKARTIKFQGYAYVREPSEVSGAIRVRYDPSKPEIWNIPLHADLKVVSSVRAPRAGYLVPAAHAGWVAEKLKIHGVVFERLEAARLGLPVGVFRATEAAMRADSYEGLQMLSVKGAWAPEKHDIRAGALYVPVNQPRGRLAIHLFEPTGPDSFLSWGFFNAAFERKEYMEDYVAEDVARVMMEKDPALKAEFQKKLATEPDFAKSADQRLNFFVRRHPSWDDRYRLYPVYRVDTKP
jgi:murein tripeptide amidase MpaA